MLPGFPGAGGDIKEQVLYAQFGSEKHQGTIFGEISGQETDRVKSLPTYLDWQICIMKFKKTFRHFIFHMLRCDG